MLGRIGLTVLVSVASAAFGQTTMTSAELQPRVQVFPFKPVVPGADDGIGRGIQQSLQVDVTKTGASLVMAPVPDGADALATAKADGAKLAVTGTYQVVGDLLRANGQMIDVTTGQSLGGFSATGPKAELFKLEDALAEQMKALLPGTLPPPDTTLASNYPPQTPSGGYTMPAQSPTNNYYNTTYYGDSTPSYAYGYPYGYYGYGYPYYDGLFVGGYIGFGGGYYRPYYGGRYNYYRGGYNSYYNGSRGGFGRPFSGVGGGLRSNPGFNNPINRGGIGGASVGHSFGGGGGAFHGGGSGGRR